MRVMVTGGAGFIGSNLCAALLRDDTIEQVVCVDDCSTGRLQNIASLKNHPRFKFILDSILAERVWLELHGMDIVYHLAAIPSVPRSWKNPRATFNANVAGTHAMLQAVHDAGVNQFVFTSSSSVYGGRLQHDAKECQVEHQNLCVKSPYAGSKLVGESLCQAYATLGDVCITALRFFNVYGPNQNPDGGYAAVIPKWITRCMQGEPIEIYGDGQQYRAFTYIDDVVELLKKIRSTPRHDNTYKVFNVASTTTTTLNRVAEDLQDHFPDLAQVNLPPRKGDVVASRADVSHVLDVYGWEAKTSFEEGLARTVESLKT